MGYLVVGIQDGAPHESGSFGLGHVQVEALSQVGQGLAPAKTGQARVLHQGHGSQNALCYAPCL